VTEKSSPLRSPRKHKKINILDSVYDSALESDTHQDHSHMSPSLFTHQQFLKQRSDFFRRPAPFFLRNSSQKHQPLPDKLSLGEPIRVDQNSESPPSLQRVQLNIGAARENFSSRFQQFMATHQDFDQPDARAAFQSEATIQRPSVHGSHSKLSRSHLPRANAPFRPLIEELGAQLPGSKGLFLSEHVLPTVSLGHSKAAVEALDRIGNPYLKKFLRKYFEEKAWPRLKTLEKFGFCSKDRDSFLFGANLAHLRADEPVPTMTTTDLLSREQQVELAQDAGFYEARAMLSKYVLHADKTLNLKADKMARMVDDSLQNKIRVRLRYDEDIAKRTVTMIREAKTRAELREETARKANMKRVFGKIQSKLRLVQEEPDRPWLASPPSTYYKRKTRDFVSRSTQSIIRSGSPKAPLLPGSPGHASPRASPREAAAKSRFFKPPAADSAEKKPAKLFQLPATPSRPDLDASAFSPTARATRTALKIKRIIDGATQLKEQNGKLRDDLHYAQNLFSRISTSLADPHTRKPRTDKLRLKMKEHLQQQFNKTSDFS
jgi:hypothetical protein